MQYLRGQTESLPGISTYRQEEVLSDTCTDGEECGDLSGGVSYTGTVEEEVLEIIPSLPPLERGKVTPVSIKEKRQPLKTRAALWLDTLFLLFVCLRSSVCFQQFVLNIGRNKFVRGKLHGERSTATGN